MKRSGIPSVLELSRKTKLHRNTINYYLSGHAVFQPAILTLAKKIGRDPLDIVKTQAKDPVWRPIAGLIDALHSAYPHITFFLFGSRARGLYKKFSDYDVGCYAQKGISLEEYFKLIDIKDDWCDKEENVLYQVDLVNFCRADKDFIDDNKKDFIFLTGSLMDWLFLIEGGVHDNG
ncbi:nucleotidyltransferase domain-containing protein [bacterium]|nr:nucleotidyltransferase domain-containing protein [bacterium]